jgi:phage terminase Nu1 subunit (DNA packaging protein)
METESKSPSDLLARRNLQNIAVKLKAGKTLTTAERKALNEFQSEQSDGWVKDTTALAKELGLSRQAIYDARARFQNAPAKHEDGRRENLVAWQQFCAENVIGKDTATRNLSDLKAELMREQIKLARMKNAEAKREVIGRDLVSNYLISWVAKLDLILTTELENNLPSLLIGQPIDIMRLEMRKAHDRIRESTRRGLSAWEDLNPVLDEPLPEVFTEQFDANA